jgi:hypothetical protein
MFLASGDDSVCQTDCCNDKDEINKSMNDLIYSRKETFGTDSKLVKRSN